MIVLFFLTLIATLGNIPITQLQGAWLLKGSGDPGEVASLIITENYMTIAVYNETSNDFLRTYGGAIKLIGHKLFLTLEFDTKDTTSIGRELEFAYEVSTTSLILQREAKVTWKRLDDYRSDLAGCWRITARAGNDGAMHAMPRTDRKTLKMMSGTRFQWIAINPATKQFSGTGGGNYTLVDGKYTEYIEFFSRDKTRVGHSLSFEASIDGGRWDHRGTSSTGSPVHEIWTRQ